MSEVERHERLRRCGVRRSWLTVVSPVGPLALLPVGAGARARSVIARCVPAPLRLGVARSRGQGWPKATRRASALTAVRTASPVVGAGANRWVPAGSAVGQGGQRPAPAGQLASDGHAGDGVLLVSGRQLGPAGVQALVAGVAADSGRRRRGVPAGIPPLLSAQRRVPSPLPPQVEHRKRVFDGQEKVRRCGAQ